MNSASALITDAVTDFRQKNNCEGALCKVVFDWNSDGKSDVFICEKKEYDDAVENGEPAHWMAYIANAEETAYTVCDEEQLLEDGVAATGNAWPKFDPEQTFVGTITEIDKFGYVSIHIENPKEGDPKAHIFAMTYTDGKFTRHDLGEYNAKEENALYDKYLEDEKRTELTIVQIPAIEPQPE